MTECMSIAFVSLLALHQLSSRTPRLHLHLPIQACNRPAEMFAMDSFQCPIDEATDTSQGIACHCCDTKVTSFKNLVRHYSAKHGHTTEEMKNHYIYKKYLEERRKASGPELTQLEKEHVGLSYHDDGEVDEEHFMCLKCTSGIRRFTKRRCSAHMVSKHEVSIDLCKNWLCVKDGNLLKNQRDTTALQFTKSFMAGAEEAQADIWEAGAEDAQEDTWGAQEACTEQLSEDGSEQEEYKATNTEPEDEQGEVKPTLWRKKMVYFKVDEAGNIDTPMEFLFDRLDFPAGGVEWADPEEATPVVAHPPGFRMPAALPRIALILNVEVGEEPMAAKP